MAAAAVAVCGLASPAAVSDTRAQSVQAPDSVTDAAATFIVSNIRQGIDMVLQNIADMGLEVDSAQVISLVAERLSNPYDPEAHRNAARVLTETAQGMSAQREREFMDAARARAAAASSGATITDSGLVIETLAPGEGATVAPTDTVVFHYKGTLPGGTVFDDTTGGEPLGTVASQLVPGMTEGLSHMSKGGRYRLSIPSALAYGSRGAGGVIPPDTPIEFTVEIVDINPANNQ